MPQDSKRIIVIQGHPDPEACHFGHALAHAYAKGASEAGRAVDVVDVARLGFPLLHSNEELENGEPPEAIREVQDKISHADHLVLFYPVWNGGAPALLRGFMEQTFRPSFVFRASDRGLSGRNVLSFMLKRKALRGKSARIVATMQMPAFFYRLYFRPHPERNVLRVGGVRPVRETFIGNVESRNSRRRERWLRRMHELGARGA